MSDWCANDQRDQHLRRAKVLWAFPIRGRDDVIELLEDAGCEVRLGVPYEERERPMTEDQFCAAVSDLHGVMVSGRETVTRSVLEAGQNLVVVSKRGIGIDKIDLQAATDFGIMVTNTPVPGHRTAVAEYGVALMFAVAKKLVEADRILRGNRFDHLQQILVNGKTAGVIGYGHVGREAARMLKGVGLHVLSYDPYASPDETSVGFEELLARADVVTLHCNLTEENRYLLNEDTIARMKPGAMVVNTARGGLVKESALAEAIRDGRISGAGLNVFEVEPPPADSPMFADDISHRVVLTPHGAGGNVAEVRERMPTAMAQFHLAALRGQVPESDIVSPVVNPEVLPDWRGRTRAPLL